METGTIGGEDTQLAATHEESEDEVVFDPLVRGEQVGRYVVLARLGAGGMGVVYAAYDPELDRKVAVKLLLRGEVGAGQVRLLREAQALARLQHPNVVAVHDTGVHAGKIFIAMEFVAGRTLSVWLGERRRSWAEVLAMVVAAGRGLAAAHEKGLVHRDVKPENVMVGDDERVRVMDFGLASAVGTDTLPEGVMSASAMRALAQPLTHTGAVLGTPAYMSAQQWAGAPADASADQYAYCVMLWEALYGVRPFVGETPMMLAASVARGVVQEPPRSAVPTWLRRTIQRGLIVDPAQRWPSIQGLLDELTRAQGRARKRRVVVAMLGVVAMAGLVGGGVLFARHQRAVECAALGRGIDDVWHEEASRRVRDGLLASGAGNAATTVEKVLPRLDEWSGQWAEAREGVCVAAELAGTIDAATAARADECFEERRMRLGAVVDELARGDAAVVQRAVLAVAGLPGVAACEDPAELARRPRLPADGLAEAREIRGLLAQAYALHVAGRFADGRVVAADALARAEALGFAPLIAEAAQVMGRLLDGAGDYEGAEAAQKRAYVTAGLVDAVEVAADAAVELIAVTGYRRTHASEAEVWAQAAEVAVARSEARPGVRTAMRLSNLGRVRMVTGDAAGARSLHEQALALWISALGPEHIDVAAGLNHVASALYNLGVNAEAEPLHRRALDIRTRALGPDHPQVAVSLNNLAAVLRETGRVDEAVALQRRALEIRETALGPEHPDVAASCFNVAISVRSTTDPRAPEFATVAAELEQLLRRALKIWEKTLGPSHVHLTYALIGLAELELDRGDPGGALAPAVRALEIREASEVAPGLRGEARYVLAQALWNSRGDRTRARELATRALADLREDGHDPRMLAGIERWVSEHPAE